MDIRAGDRFYAIHSVRGMEFGTIMSVTEPGEFMDPFVQVRFDGGYSVEFFPRHVLRIIR
jgi:hypothetical protein